MMNDEISEDHLEEKGSPTYVEDSYEADSYIPLNDVIEKWQSIVRRVVMCQNAGQGERAFNSLMSDKWGDFEINFKIYTNQGDGTFIEEMKSQTRTMTSIYPIKCENISNFIIYGIQMDIRAVYNPLDSTKIEAKVLKGEIIMKRFSFSDEKLDFINGKRKIQWIEDAIRRRSNVSMEEIEESNADWNKFWINPGMIHQICTNVARFETEKPGHTKVNSDWVRYQNTNTKIKLILATIATRCYYE